MSDIDRAISEAAIAISSPVSALNFRGIRMPLILRKLFANYSHYDHNQNMKFSDYFQ
jgi:hypothetical protein